VLYFGDCDVLASGLEALPGGKLLLSGVARQDDFERPFTLRLQENGVPDPRYGSGFPGQAGYASIALSVPAVPTSTIMHRGNPVLSGWCELGDQATNQDFLLVRLSDGRLFRDGYEAAL